MVDFDYMKMISSKLARYGSLILHQSILTINRVAGHLSLSLFTLHDIKSDVFAICCTHISFHKENRIIIVIRIVPTRHLYAAAK